MRRSCVYIVAGRALLAAVLGSPFDPFGVSNDSPALAPETVNLATENSDTSIQRRAVDDLGCTFRPFAEPDCQGQQLGTFRYYFVHGCQPCQNVVAKFRSFKTSDLCWNGSFNRMFYRADCIGLSYDEVFYNETLGCFNYHPEFSDGWYSFQPCIGGR